MQSGEPLAGKIAVVTGANAGIGFETAAGLAKAGARVVMACRSVARAEAARSSLVGRAPGATFEVMELDLASLASVRAFTEAFKARHDRLDVLVNNAGVLSWGHDRSVEGWELQFATNHLGPFLLTMRLLDRLKASGDGRIVTVASDAHRSGRLDLGPGFDPEALAGGFAGYSNSKLANILFTRELARRLQGERVTANCLHPGVIATQLFGVPWPIRWLMKPFTISPQAGARTSLHLAMSPEVAGQSGGYYDRCRRVEPARHAQDDDAARRLWEKSEQLVADGAITR